MSNSCLKMPDFVHREDEEEDIYSLRRGPCASTGTRPYDVFTIHYRGEFHQVGIDTADGHLVPVLLDDCATGKADATGACLLGPDHGGREFSRLPMQVDRVRSARSKALHRAL